MAEYVPRRAIGGEYIPGRSQAATVVPQNQPQESFDYTDPSNYSKALEGLGLATGITGDISESVMNNPIYDNPVNRRFGNIQESITGGVENAARETAANTLDMVGGMVPGAQGLWDTADSVREPIPENSIGKLMGDTVSGGVAGGAAGKLLGLAIKSPADRIVASGDKARELFNNIYKNTNNIDAHKAIKKAAKFKKKMETPPRPPIVNLASKLPVVGRAAGKVWDKTVGDLLDVPLSSLSNTAANRRFNKIVKDFESIGMDKLDAESMTTKLLTELKTKGGKLPDNLSAKTGTAIGTLLGASKDD